ncbi:MAG: T9SS type A sorting domain-containing protein [Bacteroidia bacterium]|nr:T9SS type A sorting domain-containing protein [Bacteroidia bacterium]
MELKNQPHIGLELNLRKAVIITSVFAVLITTGVFIYTNLTSSTDTYAGTHSTVFSCNGPGGVGDASTNRFYYDLDSSGYSNNDEVPSITNSGGNGAPWTQNSGSQRPTFRTDSLAMNGHPVLHFDGNNDYLKMADQSDLNKSASTQRTYMVVFRTSDDINSRQVLYEEGGATRGINIYINNGKLCLGGWNRANDGADAPWSFVAVDSGVTTETEYMVTLIYDGSNDNTTSGRILGYLNGKLMGIATGIGKLYSHGDDIGLGGMNNNSYFENGAGNGTGLYFKGEIATFVQYNYALDSADRNILENSIASKFGLTISNDLFPHDQNGFHHDIAGIGRSGTDMNTCAASGSLIQISNASDLDSGEYLMFGYNMKTGATSSNNPTGINSRWNRELMFEEIGDVGTVDVTFNLDQAEFNIADANDLRLMSDADGDGDMSDAQVVSGVYNSSAGTVTFSGVAVGNDAHMTIGSVSATTTLPVEFTYFKATKVDDQAELTWATATEIDNSHFEIERSLDGKEFEYIGEELGNGNSSNIIEYMFVDPMVPVQRTPIYYRLKQVDFDGAFEYSPIVYITSEEETRFKVYPNPASSVLTVSQSGHTFDVSLLDPAGNSRFSRRGVQDQIQINVSHMPNGLYVLAISGPNGDESHKIIIRH